jgi:hypothetical protein
MNKDPSDTPMMQDKYFLLERAFIDDFLRLQGYDFHSVQALPEDQRLAMLTEATKYAAVKLAEVEARAHYVHDLHGTREG